MAQVALETLTETTVVGNDDLLYVVLVTGSPIGRKVKKSNLISGFAATVHTHSTADIVSGTLDIARIP